MWPSRTGQSRQLDSQLAAYEATSGPLPGLADRRARATLLSQLVASLRREDYYKFLQQKAISARRANPNDPMFNPEKAIAFHLQCGNVDEACWLIFLMTHFAKPADSGWQRLTDVYGQLGQGVWDWKSVSRNPAFFENWISANWQGVRGKFGNHRKYESLRPGSNRSTGKVVRSYVNLIGAQGHQHFFQQTAFGRNDRFGALYDATDILSFGRLAKFDYLMLLARYQIVQMRPLSAYLSGATGPSRGAKLLFTGSANGNVSSQNLQISLDGLDGFLNVGMAVLEDALCNWQKQPLTFVHFKG